MNETTEKLESLSVSGQSAKSLAALAPKTPVSLLQELYVRKGITPKYDLVQIEGAVHEPTFKYRVSVGDLVATGCGQSKKKAKHTAAKAMLDKLMALSSSSEVPTMTPTAAKVVDLPKDLDAELMSPHDDGIDGNPVGDLQETCMNRRLPPPNYEVSLEKGAPHERSFVMVCSVGGNLRETGSGKSKKLAKRQAAFKMLQTLRSMPVERDNDQSLAMIDEDDLAQGIAKKTSASQRGENGHAQLLKFHRDLKIGRGPHLAGLHMEEEFNQALENEPEAVLMKIAQEQEFDVTFVEVEEKSKDNKHHYFVQLSTNPVAVCFGIGETSDLARINSAANALQYLRIMTR